MNKILTVLKKLIKKYIFSPFFFSPPTIIALSFLSIILIGSFLLTLPIATESNISTPYLDALFTSTSATCVTGLVIYDTAPYWSAFGEIVILSLIQIGGLGFITLATFFLSIAGKKTGLRSMVLTMESLNVLDVQEAIPLVRQIFKMVFFIELIGACILSIEFVPKFGISGLYYGIFHSVSSFCNAGFDLMGGGFNSMSNYNDNPLILYTMCLLIIVGGLGFIVWKDILDFKKTKKLLVHTKMVFVLSAILLILGFLFIYLVEYNHALSHLPADQKINASIFLSVNSRTAGFSSFNLDNLQSITKIFVSMLMFIGAASGSTAGGIKINTIGIMIISIICVIRSKDETVLLKRRIPNNVVLKAFAITLLAGILVFSVTLVLNLIQPELSLINTFFESVSGFGTVGLSTGITPLLNNSSKLLIIINMFAGRIGPLSFALALSLIKRSNSNTIYPDGKFIVG